MLLSPGNKILKRPENGKANRAQIWELLILIYDIPIFKLVL